MKAVFQPINILVCIAILLSLAAGVYAFTSTKSISKQLETINTAMASSSLEFKENIGSLAEKLDAQAQKSDTINTLLTQTQENIGSVEQKFGKVSNTVSELEKLTKADPKLLQKYSKVFFLNEHYEPERLAEIPKKYVLSQTRTESINAKVAPFLEDMLEDAEDDGIQLLVVSSYRSFDTQAALKNQYTVTYGAGTANQFSADQGYSEHQLGTTLDFSTPKLGTGYTAFENTPAYKWLVDNAHKYGFVISYPKGNTYYVFEPWHWRFVGEDLARDLHEDNKFFYDLEQREIDKYLPDMFD